jgi:hypothetical protein
MTYFGTVEGYRKSNGIRNLILRGSNRNSKSVNRVRTERIATVWLCISIGQKDNIRIKI